MTDDTVDIEVWIGLQGIDPDWAAHLAETLEHDRARNYAFNLDEISFNLVDDRVLDLKKFTSDPVQDMIVSTVFQVTQSGTLNWNSIRTHTQDLADDGACDCDLTHKSGTSQESMGQVICRANASLTSCSLHKEARCDADGCKGDSEQRKRIRRFAPHVKTSVQLMDVDVICERGGNNNTHPGTQAFRNYVKEAFLEECKCGQVYRSLEPATKKILCDKILNWVLTQGGRFIARDRTKYKCGCVVHSPWFVVHEKIPRQKIMQYLRDLSKEQT
jgi:hypothetical protein